MAQHNGNMGDKFIKISQSAIKQSIDEQRKRAEAEERAKAEAEIANEKARLNELMKQKQEEARLKAEKTAKLKAEIAENEKRLEAMRMARAGSNSQGNIETKAETKNVSASSTSSVPSPAQLENDRLRAEIEKLKKVAQSPAGQAPYQDNHANKWHNQNFAKVRGEDAKHSLAEIKQIMNLHLAIEKLDDLLAKIATRQMPRNMLLGETFSGAWNIYHLLVNAYSIKDKDFLNDNQKQILEAGKSLLTALSKDPKYQNSIYKLQHEKDHEGQIPNKDPKILENALAANSFKATVNSELSSASPPGYNTAIRDATNKASNNPSEQPPPAYSFK